MTVKAPRPPSPSPSSPSPKPHLGGEGTPTPIFSKFPPSASAGSPVNSGSSSRSGNPSSLQGSSAGNTGRTDPIPPSLPAAGNKTRTLSNDLFSQRIKDNFGIKNLSIDISENSPAPIWKEGVAYIKSEGTIFPVRTSRFATDGETWEIYSPSDPTKPGHSIKFEATGWKSNNNTGLQGGAPVDPRLIPYRAPTKEIAATRLLDRDPVDSRIIYNNTAHDSGYIVFDNAGVYRWRDFVSTRPSGEQIVERRLVTEDRQAGPLLVQDQVTGLWSLQQQQVDAWFSPSSQPGASTVLKPLWRPFEEQVAGTSAAPKPLWRPYEEQAGTSAVPKRPHPPDEEQALPIQRPRIDGAQPLPPGGGMRVEDMPPELIRGSGGFWGSKKPETRQLAANLFGDGKIRDVTYGNGGREINGRFNNDEGKEHRFSFISGGTSKVTFQDMHGNSADLPGLNGRDFSSFLREIGGVSAPPIGGVPAPERPRSPIMTRNMPVDFSIPDELNSPAASFFWLGGNGTTRRQMQFLLTELYRNREIYGINFDNTRPGNLHLNAVMRYQGRDYNFSVGTDHRVIFNSRNIPPGFSNRQSFSEVLERLASQTVPGGTRPT